MNELEQACEQCGHIMAMHDDDSCEIADCTCASPAQPGTANEAKGLPKFGEPAQPGTHYRDAANGCGLCGHPWPCQDIAKGSPNLTDYQPGTDAALHEDHTCRDCGAIITLPYAQPGTPPSDVTWMPLPAQPGTDPVLRAGPAPGSDVHEAYLAGYRDATVDLTPPPSEPTLDVERLARALKADSVRRWVHEAWVDSDVSEPGYATPDEMARSIAAEYLRLATIPEGAPDA